MLITIALIFIVTGLIVGILSGLFGLGGGLTVVPVMVLFLEITHLVAPGYVMHVAIATSLFVMIFTSLVSTYSHYKAKDIIWSAVWPLGFGVLAGAVGGAIIAHWLPSTVLKIFFLIFLAVTILKWIRKTYKKSHQSKDESEVKLPNNIFSTIYGCITGGVAVLLGIGCSVMAVPFMRHHKFSMCESSAIASAITPALALVGATVYIILGWHNVALPEYSLGFVYLPAVVGLAIGALFGAPLGTWLSHVMPEKLQEKIYLAFLVIILIVMLF